MLPHWLLLHFGQINDDDDDDDDDDCLGGAAVRRWTRDRKVAGSTPGRGAIKSIRSTQPSIPPG